ncbi:MAG: BtaA family protein [Blastocatellia bacterium]|nr:BtaA family protein [Blastocatellia bacterium]
MTSEPQLIDAVTTSRITTKSGLMQRLFAYWFDAFVYNQIWEDPDVDLEALEIDGNSRILTISSGGCNALNYLVAEPESVTAVDLNRYHIYLLRLKLTALRHLPDHESFFNFFGRGKHPNNIENYAKFIGPNLDDETRQFWHSNGLIGHLVDGERINYFANGGLYDRSRNGYFLRFFHRFAHIAGLHPERLLDAKSAADQQRLFDENIAPFFDSRFIRIVGKMPVTMFGLGIPPQQLDELKADVGHGATLIDVYRDRAHKLACGFPISENYFAWQAFGRRYDTDNRSALPNYLRERNFDRLKTMSCRVSSDVTSVTEKIREFAKGTFNRFVFLDAQDWMDANSMTELWQMIASKGEKGSRIIFRTAASQSPLDRNLPSDLLNRFTYERELSNALFAKDRASIYGGFHLYELKD